MWKKRKMRKQNVWIHCGNRNRNLWNVSENQRNSGKLFKIHQELAKIGRTADFELGAVEKRDNLVDLEEYWNYMSAIIRFDTAENRPSQVWLTNQTPNPTWVKWTAWLSVAMLGRSPLTSSIQRSFLKNAFQQVPPRQTTAVRWIGSQKIDLT